MANEKTAQITKSSGCAPSGTGTWSRSVNIEYTDATNEEALKRKTTARFQLKRFGMWFNRTSSYYSDTATRTTRTKSVSVSFSSNCSVSVSSNGCNCRCQAATTACNRKTPLITWRGMMAQSCSNGSDYALYSLQQNLENQGWNGIPEEISFETNIISESIRISVIQSLYGGANNVRNITFSHGPWEVDPGGWTGYSTITTESKTITGTSSFGGYAPIDDSNKGLCPSSGTGGAIGLSNIYDLLY